MRKCSIKSGFFVLHDCSLSSVLVCKNCLRSVCKDHSIKKKIGVICFECSPSDALDSESRDISNFLSDKKYAYQYRKEYYKKGFYQPLYLGSKQKLYYDSLQSS
ncbi:MAG: hypothetical protein ACI86H_001877 [bacterium]|jgi:hypothetical protein